MHFFQKVFSAIFGSFFYTDRNKLKIEFVTPSHNPEILENNLLKSKILRKYKLAVQTNYTNISKAYNEADVNGDIIIYVHHDVYLPPSFERKLLNSLTEIERIDPNWGVLGLAGAVMSHNEKRVYGYLLNRGRRLGSPKGLPREVDTLDELMLITRGDLKFDENIPSTHFYGADICLQARLQGRKCYVINAYCHHNHNYSGLVNGERTEGFLLAQEYIKKKYAKLLPIPTTCTIIS